MKNLYIKKLLRPVVVNYRHRQLKDNDIFLASYPKSGNTWLKFMLSSLFSKDEVDFDKAESLLPFVGNHINSINLLPDGRRIIKTHESFRRVYKNAIYIIRDGRDVAISYYYHHLREETFKGELNDFVKIFLQGKVDGLDPWHKHIESWIKAGEHSNILFLIYEDCLENPFRELKKIIEFLNINVSDKVIQYAIETNTKEKMRTKEKDSTFAIGKITKKIPFVRKGKSKEWESVYSDELKKEFYEVAGKTLDRFYKK